MFLLSLTPVLEESPQSAVDSQQLTVDLKMQIIEKRGNEDITIHRFIGLGSDAI